MNHLFHNLRRNILVPETTAAINKYVKEQRLMSYAKSPELSKTIFQIWQSNVSLVPVFTVLLKLVSMDSNRQLWDDILAKISEVHRVCEGPWQIRPILQISSQLFIAACNGYGSWSDFDRFFIDEYGEHLAKASHIDILWFMESITVRSKMPKDLLTFSKYPFLIFRKWIEMLSVCVTTLGGIIGTGSREGITSEQC